MSLLQEVTQKGSDVLDGILIGIKRSLGISFESVSNKGYVLINNEC